MRPDSIILSAPSLGRRRSRPVRAPGERRTFDTLDSYATSCSPRANPA